MTRPTRRLLIVMTAALAWSLTGSPMPAQTTEDQLQEIEAELARIEADAQQLTEDYLAAWATDAELADSIDDLESRIADYGVEQRYLQEQIRERAVDLYMSSSAGHDLAALILAGTLSDVDTRVEYMDDLRDRDQVLFNGLEILTRQLTEATESLQTDREDHQDALRRLEDLSAELNERIAAGQALQLALEAQRAEEEARARAEAEARAAFLATSTTIPPTTSTTLPVSTTDPTVDTSPPVDTTSSTTTTEAPPATTAPTTTSTSTTILVTDTTTPVATTTSVASPDPPVADPEPATMVCPVDGFNTFTDSWGAPRSGGRRHQGVDILADRGTPVVAVEAGRILQLYQGGLGGITVRLQGAGGDVYYYAHLDSWASGLTTGQDVSAGDLLGVVGTTGNAPAHIPHLHWEFQPGGGGPVNPTPLARELCG